MNLFSLGAVLTSPGAHRRALRQPLINYLGRSAWLELSSPTGALGRFWDRVDQVKARRGYARTASLLCRVHNRYVHLRRPFDGPPDAIVRYFVLIAEARDMGVVTAVVDWPTSIAPTSEPSACDRRAPPPNVLTFKRASRGGALNGAARPFDGDYRTYLSSPQWAEYAAEVRRTWNYGCAINASHPGPIEVHHRTYARVGNEAPYDCIPLCGACHERFHHLLPAQRSLFDRQRAA